MQSCRQGFNCQCGEAYLEAVEDFQLKESRQVLEFDAEYLARVIRCQKEVDQRLCNRIVKLYDIVSSFQGGSEDVSDLVKRVIQAIFLVVSKQENQTKFSISVMSSAFCNYQSQYQDLLNEDFFRPLSLRPFHVPVSEMTWLGKDAFFRSLLKFAHDGDHMRQVMQKTQLGQPVELGQRLLFRIGGLQNWSMYSNLVCYLDPIILKDLFLKCLSLWSDPIISKAYVYKEVIHYTKLSTLIFSHLAGETVLKIQDNIISLITQGLPNHFSSTDPRSITLAKFFCELLTESLKVYEKRSEEIPTSLIWPQEEINQQLLQSVHNCPAAQHFCQNFKIGSKKPDQEKPVEKDLKSVQDDDDDDSDFEPIETLEAPLKTNVAYIRDFIETLSEDKPYEERLAIFNALPNVVKHQIKHEHPQVGGELLRLLVRWENDFDCAQMDIQRKESLCHALLSKMDGNAQIMCQLFLKDEIRVPQQLLIIDVLSKVASEASLANLEILSRAAFGHLLQEDIFERCQVSVKIPAILFFHRLLSTMPIPMIRSEMMSAYFKALLNLKSVDVATQQTISYSLHHLVDRLRGIQLHAETSPNDEKNLSSMLIDMRAWMWKIQHTHLTSKT